MKKKKKHVVEKKKNGKKRTEDMDEKWLENGMKGDLELFLLFCGPLRFIMPQNKY